MSMRVLGAIRLSNLTDETTSPVRQRADILGDPVVKAGELVDWAEDLDVSADKFSPFSRPQLGPWLHDRAREFDVLVFAKADRAIRSMMDMYDLSKWAITHRKMIVFVKGPADGPRMELDFRNGPLDPITQLIVTIFAFAGEIEVGNIKGRTRESQALAREQGRWHGGTPPYGYKPEKQPTGQGWKLVHDEEAKKTIEGIIERVLDGESVNSITRDFNESGVLSPRDQFRKHNNKPPKNSKWTTPVILGILRSKALLGYSLKDGNVLRGPDGMPIMRAEPLVSRSTWEAVQIQLQQNAVTKPRSRSTSPLLGVVFCLECGNARYRYTGSTVVPGEYYRCRGKIWKLGCESASVQGHLLTTIVQDQLLSHIGDFEVTEEVYIAGESHQEELKEAQEGLEDLLVMSVGKSKAVKAVYDRQIASLEALIERLSALPETPSRVEHVGTGKTYRDLWEASDPQDRRKLLLEAGVRIEAAPANGQWVSVGRFERPERYYQAVSLGVYEDVQYAFYIPTDLLDRATRRQSP